MVASTEAAEVLCAIAARGAEFRISATSIDFRPARLATEDERCVLRSAASAGLGRALAWRVEAMRAQVPPRPLPIPALLARPGLPVEPGRCVSCAEMLVGDSTPMRARCALCALAAWLALADYPAAVVA